MDSRFWHVNNCYKLQIQVILYCKVSVGDTLGVVHNCDRVCLHFTITARPINLRHKTAEQIGALPALTASCSCPSAPSP
jgi:hypothetical protein